MLNENTKTFEQTLKQFEQNGNLFADSNNVDSKEYFQETETAQKNIIQEKSKHRSTKKVEAFIIFAWFVLGFIQFIWHESYLKDKPIVLAANVSLSILFCIATTKSFEYIYISQWLPKLNVEADTNKIQFLFKVISISLILSLLASLCIYAADTAFDYFLDLKRTYAETNRKSYFANRHATHFFFNYFIFWLQYIFIWVLGFYFRQFFRETINAKQSKYWELQNTYYKLERAKKDLAEKNTVLDIKNVELEEKNTELDKKNIELDKKNVELDHKNDELKSAIEDVRLLKEKRDEILKAQMDEHFLFNTLTAINGMITKDLSIAKEMMNDLSDVLRYAVYSKKECEKLEKEIEIVQKFVRLQQNRFYGQLIIDTEKLELLGKHEKENIDVPILVLQTLVENAIKHGFEKNNNSGEINLDAYINDTHLCIHIYNSGCYEPDENSAGIGLKNSRTRLQNLYNDSACIKIENHMGGVRTTLTLPIFES